MHRKKSFVVFVEAQIKGNQLKHLNHSRPLSSGSYSSHFHVYRLEWLPTGIAFKVDGQTVGSLSPPAGGFWELSGLTGANPWTGGTRMAPFDQKI